jgi:hypothetical protein
MKDGVSACPTPGEQLVSGIPNAGKESFPADPGSAPMELSELIRSTECLRLLLECRYQRLRILLAERLESGGSCDEFINAPRIINLLSIWLRLIIGHRVINHQDAHTPEPGPSQIARTHGRPRHRMPPIRRTLIVSRSRQSWRRPYGASSRYATKSSTVTFQRDGTAAPLNI